MAVLIIDRVESSDDVLNLARHLLDALAAGEVDLLVAPGTVHLTKAGTTVSAQDLDSHLGLEATFACPVRFHREDCSCEYDRAHLDPRQGVVVEADRHDGPVAYVPCHAQGTHPRLTECWMCWSDVHRSVLDAHDALADSVGTSNRITHTR